jgi:co-chaperonin GroES (HSP10)
MNLRPLPNNIFAQLQVGERVSQGGIVLRDDNGKAEGIRPRWGKVWKVSEDINYLKPGQWILCEHGRWTMAITIKDDEGNDFKFSKIDPNGILCVQDEAPDNDIQMGDSFDTSPSSVHRAEDFGAR